MNQEHLDYQYFKENQLHSVDFKTGEITTIGGKGGKRIYNDIGSLNKDGYVRLWCNRHLRMKHRLVYFLYYGVVPNNGDEIDHIDKVRNNNCIGNLRIVSKSVNNTGSTYIKKRQFSIEVIKKVCELLQETSLSDLVIAEKTGVSRGTVRDIKIRKKRQKISHMYVWNHRGY